ncbi:MAG: type II toxin-antitoxin system HicB family antitoxin [Bacteroidetes bacterium]|nr:type II toxin-antitoxin system HicB family antitoxin [Bacteroidota bacterium]
MLVQYVNTAILDARYERLDYGLLAYIPEFDGLWVLEETKQRAEEELLVALEHWLISSFHRGLTIPVVDGMDLKAYWEAEGAPEYSMRGSQPPAS